jgi:hypothetical protein
MAGAKLQPHETAERITAAEIEPGDRIAKARTHLFMRVEKIESAGASSRWIRLEGSDRIRPRHTAPFWRIVEPDARELDPGDPAEAAELTRQAREQTPGHVRPNAQQQRRARLAALVGDHWVHDPETAAALDGGEVPRYATVTSEGSYQSSYRDNPNVAVYSDLEALAAGLAGEIDEGWIPNGGVHDLETGEEVGYRIRVEIEAGS